MEYSIKKRLYNDQTVLEENKLDFLQGGLDIVGLVPGIGEAADGLNALISLARDNPLEAILSAISMIPGAGDVVGKGGKVILKTFEPAMDIIKKGGKQTEIMEKIGPEAMKKLEGMLGMFKDALVKYQPKIKELIEIVKSGDIDKAEQAMGFKLPAIGRGKAEELLKKASANVDMDGMAKVFDFFSGLNASQEAEPIKSSYNPRGYLMMENPTILAFIMGEEYINKELKKFANELRMMK
jgi:hypothetical protein